VGWFGDAEGFRTHRSWWVAAAAIRDVRWRRGSALLRLEGGLEVPVSRAFARTLALAKRI
jgi:DNA-binding LytR/AlgR family response regulator